MQSRDALRGVAGIGGHPPTRQFGAQSSVPGVALLPDLLSEADRNSPAGVDLLENLPNNSTGSHGGIEPIIGIRNTDQFPLGVFFEHQKRIYRALFFINGDRSA